MNPLQHTLQNCLCNPAQLSNNRRAKESTQSLENKCILSLSGACTVCCLWRMAGWEALSTKRVSDRLLPMAHRPRVTSVSLEPFRTQLLIDLHKPSTRCIQLMSLPHAAATNIIHSVAQQGSPFSVTRHLISFPVQGGGSHHSPLQ